MLFQRTPRTILTITAINRDMGQSTVKDTLQMIRAGAENATYSNEEILSIPMPMSEIKLIEELIKEKGISVDMSDYAYVDGYLVIYSLYNKTLEYNINVVNADDITTE